MAKKNNPVITSASAQAAGAIAELSGVSGSAFLDTLGNTLDFTDLDPTDTHTASFAPVGGGAGFVGAFSLGPVADSLNGATGHVAWSFTVADGALDFLS